MSDPGTTASTTHQRIFLVVVDDSEELKAIRDRLGDFPLVGFFANGEISHNRLYGYTGVLTLFL